MPADSQDRSPLDGAETSNVWEGVGDRRPINRDGEARPAPSLEWRVLLGFFLWGVLVPALAMGGLSHIPNPPLVLPVFGMAAPVVLVVSRNRALRAREGRSVARAKRGSGSCWMR